MFYIRIVSETDEGIFHLHKWQKASVTRRFLSLWYRLIHFRFKYSNVCHLRRRITTLVWFFLAFCDNIYMDDISKVNSPLALPLNVVFSSVRPICLASAPEVFIHMLSLLPFKTLGHGARKCRRATPGMTWGRCFVVLSEGTPYLIDN